MAVTDNGYVIKMTAQSDTLDKNFYAGYIRWVGATNTGHTCVLKDGSGNELFYSEADGGRFIDIHPLCRWVEGLELTTLGSGTLYVYIR